MFNFLPIGDLFRRKPKTDSRLSLPNVTLVALASTHVESTIKALIFSAKYIDFHEIVLISHERPHELPPEIVFRSIARMSSYELYNYHVVYSLRDYIHTSHALLVQHDGFVVNPDQWRDEFLKYDYIGAPFPLPMDEISYRDENGNIVRVGNGGFSLRSQRLLELPSELQLKWEPFHGFFHEDGFLCCKHRPLLERNGVKFAPLEVAKYFSHEAKIAEVKGIKPFGIHGKERSRRYARALR